MYLDLVDPIHQIFLNSDDSSCKKTILLCRFDHQGTQGMQELAKNKMVEGLNFDLN